MRKLSSAALALFLLPGVGCINLDLANGNANVFEAEIDARGTGLLLSKRNINFKQIVTIDPTTDEQRAGAVATDQINFEVVSLEFSYLLEEMNELEEAIEVGLNAADADVPVVTDPRGLEADFNVFQVGDIRMAPFLVGMFATYTRKEVILDERLVFDGDVFDFVDGFKERNVRTVESEPAFCNFIDPLDNGLPCFAFDPSKVEGLNIGAVAGVGKDVDGDGIIQNVDNNNDGIADVFEIEDTSSAQFNDLIVVDPVIYLTLLEGFLEENLGQPLNADQIEDLAKDAILLRIARDKTGILTVFNNNLGEDFR